VQRIYRAWAKALLTTKNPHTGLPLGRDPAVAIVEIVNEDNFFFWTFKPYATLPPGVMPLLERAFGDWLGQKYGSVAEAQKAWGSPKLRGDVAANGRAGLYGAWHMTRSGLKHANPRRLRDQVRFLTEHLRAFFAEIRRDFREDLGVRCLVSASNWKTADPVLLGALDKYAYTACDVIDRHGYFGGMHKGPRASFSLSQGDRYRDRCALLHPEGLPVAQVQYAGRPNIISEINWPMPNRFRADMPWLCSLYGSLQGTDGFFHFSVGTPDWLRQHTKFSIFSPVILGQFPAAALVYRRGYVKTGPPAVREAPALRDLYDLKGTAVSEPQDLDPLRAAGVPPDGLLRRDRLGRIDPLAHYVGPVVRAIGKDPGRPAVMNLSARVDRGKKHIESATGELRWDYGTGVITFDTPRAQGAVGFLQKAGPIRLGDVVIASENEYGAVAVVSLDGAPIGTSRRILVQVMTEDKNYGWETAGSGPRRITSLGGPPIVVRNLAGRVSFKHNDGDRRRITALDLNGRRANVLDAADHIRLRPNTLYYLVER
jgi:hypothetical protein